MDSLGVAKEQNVFFFFLSRSLGPCGGGSASPWPWLSHPYTSRSEVAEATPTPNGDGRALESGFTHPHFAEPPSNWSSGWFEPTFYFSNLFFFFQVFIILSFFNFLLGI
jgi:hypothetical protein